MGTPLSAMTLDDLPPNDATWNVFVSGHPAAQRGSVLASEERELMGEWMPFKVTIHQGDEAVDSVGVFDAYTRGDRWNGFVTPYFTQEEGQRVVAWTDAMLRRYPPDAVETLRWDDDLSAFVMESADYPHEPGEPIPNDDIIPAVSGGELGVDLYPVGAYRWKWQEG